MEKGEDNRLFMPNANVVIKGPVLNKKRKREDKVDSPIDESEYHMIRRVWESRNFMELNNWCQKAKAQMVVDQKELTDKSFFTELTISDNFNLLPENIVAYGTGRNKKDSKLEAMRTAMEILMEKKLIHLGIKDKKYKIEYFELIKKDTEEFVDMTDGKETTYSDPQTKRVVQMEGNLITQEMKEKLNEKDVNTCIKKILKEIRMGKFHECCEYLDFVINRKELEWYEFSFLWNYAIHKKDMKYVNTLIDLITRPIIIAEKKEQPLEDVQIPHTSQIQCSQNPVFDIQCFINSNPNLKSAPKVFLDIMQQLIINNLDLVQQIMTETNRDLNGSNPIKPQINNENNIYTSTDEVVANNSDLEENILSKSLESDSKKNKEEKDFSPQQQERSFPILFMEEIYNSLLFCNDLEFVINVARKIKNCLKYKESEFISSGAAEYYKEKRFLVFLEIIESICQTSTRILNEYNSSSIISLYGRISKTGNRFAQDVCLFSPVDKSSALSKLIKRSNINNRDYYSLISDKEFVLLSCERVSMIGYIKEIDKDLVCKVIVPSDKIGADPSNEGGSLWIMTKLNNSTTYERTIEGLKYFTTKDCCSAALQEIVFSQFQQQNKPNEAEKFENSLSTSTNNISQGINPDLNNLAEMKVNKDISDENFSVMNQFLNESQQSALKKARNQTLTLVQGPPGTGKTSIGIEIILEWIRLDSKSQILVCADSNCAVDILYRELNKAGVPAIRMGLKDESIDSDPQQYYAALRKNLRTVQVICTTCVGSLSDYLEDFKFPRVLIDEATQATELNTILPFLKGSAQVVLIGDHKQLPPTIISHTAEKEGLSISLFERLVIQGVLPTLLNIQYRMHYSISLFPSLYFYNNLVLNGVEDVTRPPILGFPWPNPGVRVCFVNVNGTEEVEGNSYSNNLEIKTLLDIILKIFQFNTVTIDQIGVITPYDAQKRKLKNEVFSLIRNYSNLFLGVGFDSNNIKNMPLCSIDTVDGFQGMDKDLILFSAVRSNLKGNVGFLKDPRRLNVMLTRAKRGLIVVGNYKCLEKETNWKEWLKWLNLYGAVFK